MATFNKIQVATEMFLEAHQRYSTASRDIDYITSVMLSGAVVGIVSPLLSEQGGHSRHSLLARIGNVVAEPSESPTHEGMFREIYNALKHAGDDRRKVAPSEDLEIHADLALEAARMLDAAKQDFRQIHVSQELKKRLAPEFLQLLESENDYA
jgi:hypothetical protein